MKKLLAIISTAITTIGLTSCGEPDPEQENVTEKANIEKKMIDTANAVQSGAQDYGSGKPNTTTKAS